MAVCPSGGLCNRLLNLAAAMRELRSLQVNARPQVLFVCWICRPACPEHFLKLFEPLEALRFIEQPEFVRLLRTSSLAVRPAGAAIRLKQCPANMLSVSHHMPWRLVSPCPVPSDPIPSHPIPPHSSTPRPSPTHPNPSHPILSHFIPPVLSHPIWWSHPISSHPIPSRPLLSRYVQSRPYHAILYHKLPCHSVPYHAYLASSCHTTPHHTYHTLPCLPYLIMPYYTRLCHTPPLSSLPFHSIPSKPTTQTHRVPSRPIPHSPSVSHPILCPITCPSCYSFVSRPTRQSLFSSLPLSIFEPLPHIATAIQDFVKLAHVESCVGLHIRRTDHAGTANARGGATTDDDFSRIAS